MGTRRRGSPKPPRGGVSPPHPRPSQCYTDLTARTYAAVMDRQKEFVLRTLEERDIRFVRLWFTDVLGYLKSVASAPAGGALHPLLPGVVPRRPRTPQIGRERPRRTRRRLRGGHRLRRLGDRR